MHRTVTSCVVLLAACGGMAAEPDGATIFRDHCVRCHGADGGGTAEVPEPLGGDRSLAQLADLIERTMPEDDPTAVTGAAARAVAAYVHEVLLPGRSGAAATVGIEPARLTARQHRLAVADLLLAFRGRLAGTDGPHGLRAEYFRGRDFNAERLVFERIDPDVRFVFGVEGPDPERFEPGRFAIRWRGTLVPPETGDYEFVVRSAHAVRLAVNTAWYEPWLIDAFVKSGDETEYRGRVPLLGGRPVPIHLEFSKANQGVDNAARERLVQASIELLWRPPHGRLEPVPARALRPRGCPPSFVVTTPFPPDDRSRGFLRGTQVSPEWFAAATATAAETAAAVVTHADHLAGTKRDADDRSAKLREFAGRFAERAFRRPLAEDVRALVVDRPFAETDDPELALERSVLLALSSPRFLLAEGGRPAATDGHATAARLALGLWDSLPDDELVAAAASGRLAGPDGVRVQAERMVGDPRAAATFHAFMLGWLRVEQGPELPKDAQAFPEWSADVVADLRTSLHVLLDAAWTAGDWRGLMTGDELPLNGRLGPLYGADLGPDAPFAMRRIDDGRRSGLLTHPYLLATLATPRDTSPIHRGVFLARGVLGNVLHPPPDAVPPLPPDLHPDLTTRQRVELQTSPAACQSCHVLINRLGFALEEFDSLGRYRTRERAGGGEVPVDATGGYVPRHGGPASFNGGRELGAVVAESPDAHEAFVQAFFHALAKQPVRAWGPDALPRLARRFADGGFDLRRLAVDIMEVAAFPPATAGADQASSSAPIP